jgi:hypothetical protein
MNREALYASRRKAIWQYMINSWLYHIEEAVCGDKPFHRIQGTRSTEGYQDEGSQGVRRRCPR